MAAASTPLAAKSSIIAMMATHSMDLCTQLASTTSNPTGPILLQSAENLRVCQQSLHCQIAISYQCFITILLSIVIVQLSPALPSMIHHTAV